MRKRKTRIVKKGYTDTDLINYLEELNNKNLYTGHCILRMSGSGRGWRLHETERLGGHHTVREAIVDFINLEKEGKLG